LTFNQIVFFVVVRFNLCGGLYLLQGGLQLLKMFKDPEMAAEQCSDLEVSGNDLFAFKNKIA